MVSHLTYNIQSECSISAKWNVGICLRHQVPGSCLSYAEKTFRCKIFFHSTSTIINFQSEINFISIDLCLIISSETCPSLSDAWRQNEFRKSMKPDSKFQEIVIPFKSSLSLSPLPSPSQFQCDQMPRLFFQH